MEIEWGKVCGRLVGDGYMDSVIKVDNVQRRSYCDKEIKGNILIKDIEKYAKEAQKIFDELIWIKSNKPGQMRYDAEGGSRYEYWNMDEGVCVLIQLNNEMIWIVGCVGCHPFVVTNEWSFYNSDGSTDATELLDEKDPIEFLKTTTMKYVMHQCH